MMSRHQREELKKGQTSPLQLSNFAINKIINISSEIGRPVNVLDIGCGSGLMMEYVKAHTNNSIHSAVGVDWSPMAINRLHNTDIYQDIKLAQSAILPFDNKQFDVALSIENLEHLYIDDVKPAILEMTRVADYVIIITPTKHDVINRTWLNQEIFATEADTEELTPDDFQMLEGAVHKSVVSITSMKNAGFDIGEIDHGRYYAPSDQIDINLINVVGCYQKPDIENLHERYCQLLHDSLNLELCMDEGL